MLTVFYSSYLLSINMSLIYALVARGNTILAEFTGSSGNFTTVTQNVLDKIPDRNQMCTYVYDRYWLSFDPSYDQLLSLLLYPCTC